MSWDGSLGLNSQAPSGQPAAELSTAFSIPWPPVTKPGPRASKQLPLTASRILSQNTAMPGFSRGRLAISAGWVSGSMGESPARHGSPYSSFSPGPNTRSSSRRMRFTSSTVIRPIRSKRKPSMWYSLAQ